MSLVTKAFIRQNRYQITVTAKKAELEELRQLAAEIFETRESIQYSRYSGVSRLTAITVYAEDKKEVSLPPFVNKPRPSQPPQPEYQTQPEPVSPPESKPRRSKRRLKTKKEKLKDAALITGALLTIGLSQLAKVLAFISNVGKTIFAKLKKQDKSVLMLALFISIVGVPDAIIIKDWLSRPKNKTEQTEKKDKVTKVLEQLSEQQLNELKELLSGFNENQIRNLPVKKAKFLLNLLKNKPAEQKVSVALDDTNTISLESLGIPKDIELTVKVENESVCSAQIDGANIQIKGLSSGNCGISLFEKETEALIREIEVTVAEQSEQSDLPDETDSDDPLNLQNDTFTYDSKNPYIRGISSENTELTDEQLKKLSPGFRYILRRESFKKNPYQEERGVKMINGKPTKIYDLPTIGYGTTVYPDGTKVKMTDGPITVERALKYAKHHLKVKTEELLKRIPYIDEMSQEQKWALQSFVYNTGFLYNGPEMEITSKVFRDRDWDRVPEVFNMWVDRGTDFEVGQRIRREEEGRLWKIGLQKLRNQKVTIVNPITKQISD